MPKNLANTLPKPLVGNGHSPKIGIESLNLIL